MIAQLTGELIDATADSAVVDVCGVGYLLHVPLSTSSCLPPLKTRLTFYTELVVREDAMTLYGFLTRSERRLFQLIVDNVKGFGPRLALNVISAMSVSAFCSAVANQDGKLLGKINGVGKKSAAQLLLDLRGKLDEFSAEITPRPAAVEDSQAVSDAVAALTTLGFRAEEARRSVEAVIASDPQRQWKVDTLLRQTLARLNSGDGA